MYIVYNEDFQEVKGNFDNAYDAVKDAIEWAEYDDIRVSVYRENISNIDRCFMVDGSGIAEQLQFMFNDEDEE